MRILDGDALRSTSVLQISLYATCLRDEVTDLSTMIDLAMEDYKHNEVLNRCPACSTVRWYILVPNEVYQEMSMSPGGESSIEASHQMLSTSPSAISGSSTLNSKSGRNYEPSSPKQEPARDTISMILEYSSDLTLISGYFPSAKAQTRGFHLACRYLDNLLGPILQCTPDIEGYDLAPLPGVPEDEAGRQIMVHARVFNDFTNLPAYTTFHPHGPAREPCVTELVAPGAYNNLPPLVVAKPKSPVVHRRNESEDSGIGLVADRSDIKNTSTKKKVYYNEEQLADAFYENFNELSPAAAAKACQYYIEDRMHYMKVMRAVDKEERDRWIEHLRTVAGMLMDPYMEYMRTADQEALDHCMEYARMVAMAEVDRHIKHMRNNADKEDFNPYLAYISKEEIDRYIESKRGENITDFDHYMETSEL